MTGLGTIVNVTLIITGGFIGLLLRRVMSVRITDTIMQGLSLGVIFIGVSGALAGSFTVKDGVISTEYTLITIISLALGGLIGELINIEKQLDKFAQKCEARFSSSGGTFSQGFITATLVFCVGTMAILGALNDGISGNRDLLYLKSALDGVTSMIFASTLGVGVLFSGVAVGLYQGTITLLARLISPFLNEQIITPVSVVGSVLIMAIGFNMLKITKLKVGNLLPAVIIPVVGFVLNRLLF